MTDWLRTSIVIICLLSSAAAHGQSAPVLNMGFSGAGIGSDLLKLIERNGLWRKHGVEVERFIFRAAR